MNAKPLSFRVFLVLGVVLWLTLTVAVLVTVAADPAKNAGLGFGLVLLWVVLLAYVGIERWTGGRRVRP